MSLSLLGENGCALLMVLSGKQPITSIFRFLIIFAITQSTYFYYNALNLFYALVFLSCDSLSFFDIFLHLSMIAEEPIVKGWAVSTESKIK